VTETIEYGDILLENSVVSSRAPDSRDVLIAKEKCKQPNESTVYTWCSSSGLV